MKSPTDVRGSELVKVLVNDFGWTVKRQRGSHVTLGKPGEMRILTVPCHPKPIKVGTVMSILRKAGIDLDEFLRK